MDATMRKMAAAASLTGEPMALDDRDARAGLEFARDATTVRRLVERAGGPERKPRGPLFVGLVGACIMLVAMVAVASAAVAFQLPAPLTLPVILGGPLVGWTLTVRR